MFVAPLPWHRKCVSNAKCRYHCECMADCTCTCKEACGGKATSTLRDCVTIIDSRGYPIVDRVLGFALLYVRH